MAQLDILTQPQRQQRGQEKDRLQLKRKRHAEQDHAPRALLLQRHVQRRQAQGGIDHVALAPICAIEDDGRQHQREVEDHDALARAPDLQTGQLRDRVSQQHLKRHRDSLDQILPRIILHPRNHQQQIQIRRRIVAADIRAQPLLDAHLGILVNPVAQKDVVVVAHIVEQRDFRQQNQAHDHAQQRLCADV